jgi:hypothetical protein
MNKPEPLITTWEMIQLIVLMSLIRFFSGFTWVLACTLDWIYSMLPKNNNAYDTFQNEVLVPIGLTLILIIGIWVQSC